MKNEFTQEQQYVLARKRVEKISKFYKSLAVYIIVNIFLTTIFIVGDVNDGVTFQEALFDMGNYIVWFFWGIGMVFQLLNTFGLSLIFNREWEEKKIKEYMNL